MWSGGEVVDQLVHLCGSDVLFQDGWRRRGVCVSLSGCQLVAELRQARQSHPISNSCPRL